MAEGVEMIMLWLTLTPDVGAGDVDCNATVAINTSILAPDSEYVFKCPDKDGACESPISVSHSKPTDLTLTFLRHADAAEGCTVLIYPSDSDSPMFILKPSSETTSLTIRDIHIGSPPDTTTNHKDFIILSEPDTDAKVTINLNNVIVTGQQDKASSFISASGGTTVSIDYSSISWASTGTSNSGGTFFLAGGSLSITNSVLSDAGVLGNTAASGQLIHASGVDTQVAVSNSVILAGSSGAPASLMQMAGGGVVDLGQNSRSRWSQLERHHAHRPHGRVNRLAHKHTRCGGG